MIQLKKTILTLVALLALTTGAWADDKKVVLKVDPITVAKGTEAEIEVKMDYTAEKTLVGLSFSLYLPDGILLKGFDTKEAQDAARASALKKAFDLDVTTGLWGNEEGAAGWFSVKPQVDGGLQITLIDQDDKTAFVNTHAPVISVYVHAVADVANVNGTINGITLTDNENNPVEQGNIADVLIPFNATAPETPLTVTWNATTKTASIASMPAGNVTVEPEYYAQAMFATEGNEALTPTAAEDAIAGTDAPLIVEGTVAKAGQTDDAQGQVMYAVTTTADAAPALTAFSATVPTAEDYDDATTVFVWYYIQGADAPTGTVPSDDNTFSDSDISGTPLQVNVLPNKFTLTFDPAPVEKVDVTVDGQAATPAQDGKLENVPMDKQVKVTAKTGYKLKKVEVKKTQQQQP